MEPHRRVTDSIAIDHKTNRSICDEMGERLQHEPSPMPPYLKRLIDELRKRDR
jgi:hypothetical protein